MHTEFALFIFCKVTSLGIGERPVFFLRVVKVSSFVLGTHGVASNIDAINEGE